jgi:ornithine carbamoyltransferase
MIFDKSSTRTRVSFETAMAEGGGAAIFLSPRDTQLGRGEPVEDSARVLSQMCDAIMVRTFSHEVIETFAAHSVVPVLNGLSDSYHPLQLLADMQTYFEHRGDIKQRKVAWVGDGNNMCNSYINAAIQLDFSLSIATPAGYEPSGLSNVPENAQISHSDDPIGAVREKFRGFQVNSDLLRHASSDVLFMHCLPAHRGEEVSADVIDHPNSVVWDEAGNRLHAQKALLELLIGEIVS